jgi:hypothetical protein
MNPQLGDVSEDGFWVLTTEGWQPSEKQLMALNQGAIPHNASLPQQTVIANYSVEGKRTQSSEVMKYIFSGAIALALILLLIGMYHDSWTGVDEDGSDRGQKGGIGLTGVTYDCSDSTGTDSDGDSNKEICKFGVDYWNWRNTLSQILIAPSVEGTVEDLPDEMSGIWIHYVTRCLKMTSSRPRSMKTLVNAGPFNRWNHCNRILLVFIYWSACYRDYRDHISVSNNPLF